jgi:predicted nucleic acid-binding protein
VTKRTLFVPRRAFIDTAATYSLTDWRDANHAAANAIQRRLVRERWTVFTSNFVVAELHALLLKRLGREVAARFLDVLDRGSTEVVRISADDEERAREILRRYTDKDFTFTDDTSFAVMERLRIPYAFTFDRHFEQFGFALVEPNRS